MIRETNVHILSRRELADWAESVRADVGVLPGPEMTASMIKTAIAHAEDAARLAEALVFCSGSQDFGPDGQARTGWVRGPAAALEAHRKLAEEALNPEPKP